MESAESDSRKTYLGTDQYVKDLHQQNQLQPTFQQPLFKSIFSYFQYNPQILYSLDGYPKVYNKLTTIFLQSPKYLQQLVCTALNPQKINITSSRQVYISASILKNCPKLVTHLLQTDEAFGLFQFLKDLKNQTSLGYFDQIFEHDQQQFQTCVFKYFAGSTSVLELCFQNCHHEEVFLVIMNSMIKSSDEGLMEFKKEIFGRFLNKLKKINKPEELMENMMDMMGIVLENLFFLRQELMQMFIDNIPGGLIEDLGNIILENYKEKPDHCEYQIRTMSHILAIYSNILKKKLSFNVIELEKTVIAIVKVFDKLIKILLDVPEVYVQFANNQTITQVGLLRYHILILFRDILKLDEQLLVKHFPLVAQNHKIIQIYLCLNRWNNMTHVLVLQCAVLLLQLQRKHKVQNQRFTRSQSFLNFLIQQFKGSQYIFLGTGNTASYGNIYYIYDIARAVAVELQSTIELQQMMKKFKPLQKFIFADLQNFEIKMDVPSSENSAYMVRSKPDSIKKLVRKMSQKDKVETHSSGGKIRMRLEDEVKDFLWKKERENERSKGKGGKDKLNSTF